MKKPAPRRAGRRRGKLEMRGTSSPKPPERRRQTARKANFCHDLQMNLLIKKEILDKLKNVVSQVT